MDKYKNEFQTLKSWDEVQTIKASGIEFKGNKAKLSHDAVNGTFFIVTSGHGYLVVPKGHKLAKVAKSICKYGFAGNLAYYLEEDCEASMFLKQDKVRIAEYAKL